MHKFIHATQRRFQDHRVGRLSGNIALHAESDTDSSSLHRGSVVDAIAEEKRRSPARLVANDRYFFFGAFRGMNLADTNLIGQITNFLITIARDKHHAIHRMARTKVPKKRASIVSRRVMEPASRGVHSVDKDDAFQTGYHGRQGETELLNPLATRDPHASAIHNASQPLSRWLADFRD